MCRLLPRSRGLPRFAGGSASAPLLSRPAQASLTLRPVGLLNRPEAAFVTRLRSGWLPTQTARQLPEQSTTLWVDPPSTGETRPRGALQTCQNFGRLVLETRPGQVCIQPHQPGGMHAADIVDVASDHPGAIRRDNPAKFRHRQTWAVYSQQPGRMQLSSTVAAVAGHLQRRGTGGNPAEQDDTSRHGADLR